MRQLRGAVLVLALTSLTTACAAGGGHSVAAPSAANNAPAQLAPQHVATSGTTAHKRQTSTEARVAQAVASPTLPSAAAPIPSGSVSSLPSGRRPTESEVPVHQGVPIQATLAARCLRPGRTQRITITTQPNSGVVYDAVYSDGKYGGTANYYGGNAGGHTDSRGRWSSHWVVAPTAPAGPVRVDVLTATPRGNGYTTVWFHVATATGRCS